MKIEKVISQRTDLGTFLVHLTRSEGHETGRDRLESIIKSGQIEARTAYGHARYKVASMPEAERSQRVVCFTETPLEHLHLQVEDIEGRQYKFEPYGIAVTKRLARAAGVNPVWYVDTTPGHDWLTNPLDSMVKAAIEAGDFEDSDIAQIAPFIERMGRKPGEYIKEFWWEREWRHRGHFQLPSRFIAICPGTESERLVALAQSTGRQAAWIDASWGLEEIIGRLAGFSGDEIGAFS